MKHMALLLVAALLCGCGESMDRQNRLKTYGSSSIPGWPAPGEAIPLPDKVVSQSSLMREKSLSQPPPVTLALLRRGRERYDIYCAPCHGLTGAGDGIVVGRGFPKPVAFDVPQLMQASAPHLVDVISHGYGAMYSFSDRVEPRDRWAIVAYIRALQLAGRRQHG